jgi:hypothetical protein
MPAAPCSSVDETDVSRELILDSDADDLRLHNLGYEEPDFGDKLAHYRAAARGARR